MTRPRGFIEDYSPTPDNRQLIIAVRTILGQYTPTYGPMTLRQIFYRLVATRGFSKTEQAYKRLGEIVNKARRAKLLDFADIRDDGDTLIYADGYQEADHAIRTINRIIEGFTLRRDCDQPHTVILMVEAAGMAPQVARVADQYGATVMSAGGFNGVTGKYNLAQQIFDDMRPTIVMHIGDYDPSGEHIFTSLAEDVEAFVDGIGEEEGLAETLVQFRRICLTPAQIAHYALPTAPAKTTDRRSFAGINGDGTSTVQCEALSPADLANVVEQALLAVWDAPAGVLTDDNEKDAREQLTIWLKGAGDLKPLWKDDQADEQDE